MTDAATPLLEINGLTTRFRTDDETVTAVDNLSLTIREGQTLGLVGESGSGKSVTSYSIMRLLPASSGSIDAGEISLFGKDLVQLPMSDMRDVRGKSISMIFQEPGTSLNPVFKVGKQVMEPMILHQGYTEEAARIRAIELFDEVGIPEPERRVDSFPHEMSGGQKQRVMIAMALSCNPKLLIADEPTTALDVTIQMQILDLIRNLRDERGMSILFITHDLGVIAEIADEVAVMFQGKLVEQNTIEEIFTNPQHPYTKGLLACRPKLETEMKRLPTVGDFMEADKQPDGSFEIIEKPMTDERLAELMNRGRGRYLHTKSEIAALGYKPEELTLDADDQFVEEGASPLLTVDQFQVYYPIKSGILRKTTDYVRAVDGVKFHVHKGQTLGLVGESGCGKTTAGRAILKLIPITGGKVTYEGQDITAMSRKEFLPFRRKVQIIFQDPYNSLNPRMTVETMLMEVMKVHKLGDSNPERRNRAAQLLEEVGLLSEHLLRYPHEFSGGQRQRLCIARALAVEPEFIICDESVSALDVSVQAQVLNLLKDLQEDRGLTYIFISHDLSVVKFMSDMMAVMQAGQIVEFGPSEEIYRSPQNEYTERLIESIPKDSIQNIRKRQQDRKEALAKRLTEEAP
ncbi:MAG: ABC transporter ATP-binding protein [Planctomycetaceae bacterium]|jgi:peptide/nickel transport system ATP-binding protein|nr:ABC transporter ATP-binding protein [Planctomycetaceae bacterium]MDG2391781.1 ABC transporter ATP-binding protein [Planctomycetaceae bacterium]